MGGAFWGRVGVGGALAGGTGSADCAYVRSKWIVWSNHSLYPVGAGSWAMAWFALVLLQEVASASEEIPFAEANLPGLARWA